MTWLFVRMLPSASMMKPLPAPRRGASRSRAACRSRTAVERIGRFGARVRPRRRRARAPRRRVDVHDRRVDPLDDVGEIDERRRRRRRGGARARRAARRGWPARRPTTADRVTPPATIAPTRNATTAVRATVTKVKRRDMSALDSIISARNAVPHPSVSTPSFRAFSSLLPASAPETTNARLLADRPDTRRRAARAPRSPPRAT